MRIRLLALVATACTLLLTSCEGVLYVDLRASGYEVTRFESWAPITVLNVRNPSTKQLSQVVITARCKEKPYENLEHIYQSAPFALGPQESIARVTVPQVDGYPVLTSGPISCAFDASNRAWPTELEVTITVK